MAIVVKTYPKKDLLDVLWGDSAHLKQIKDEIIDKSRWSIHYELTFTDTRDGSFWVVGYSEGATENQDERPFENEPDDVECVKVKPVEQTVTVYVAVDTKEGA